MRQHDSTARRSNATMDDRLSGRVHRNPGGPIASEPISTQLDCLSNYLRVPETGKISVLCWSRPLLVVNKPAPPAGRKNRIAPLAGAHQVDGRTGARGEIQGNMILTGRTAQGHNQKR